MAGLVYFEAERPELVASPEQCEALLPLLEPMGTAWKRVLSSNDAMHATLSADQEAYLLEHKSHIETSKGQREAQTMLTGFLGDRLADDAIPTTEDLLRVREAEAPAQGPAAAPAQRASILTAQDISTGIVYLEQQPELAVTPAQAAAFIPLLDRFEADNQVVGGYFFQMLELITHDQIMAVQQDIAIIVPFKTRLYEDDDTPVRLDPLFDRVIATCSERLGQPIPQGAPPP